MACIENKNRKCFTFIWKIENADYWWDRDAAIKSPQFKVDEIYQTNWRLELEFYYRHYESDLRLRRLVDKNGVVEIDCELAFLSVNGSVEYSLDFKKSVIEKNNTVEYNTCPTRNEVFFTRRSEFLTQNALTIRCKLWKSVGEFSKNVECHAFTSIAVEKMSFLWNIKELLHQHPEDKETYEIKSLNTGERLMFLELSVVDGQVCDESILLKIVPNHKIAKLSTLQMSLVDVYKNTVKCLQDEFWFNEPFESKYFTLFYSKKELMEKKGVYLPNDVLSLLCECSFSFGTLKEGIQYTVSNNFLPIQNLCFDHANELPIPKGNLINDLKSMLNNDMLSDVKLKTVSKTYPAHKCILGYRSPVFKAMFSSNMKEKNSDCVSIEDLSDETVFHMLRFIYSADVEELDWSRAIDLYEAADKYEILDLKDICSSYLKKHLCPGNACEVLVLADLHEDEDLKIFVQPFILKHGKDIINSEEWKQMMKTNLKLAAETLCLVFKE